MVGFVSGFDFLIGIIIVIYIFIDFLNNIVECFFNVMVVDN